MFTTEIYYDCYMLKTEEINSFIDRERRKTSIMYITNELRIKKSRGLLSKVHIFCEGHKIWRNLHLTFDWHYLGQMEGEEFAKFCGLLGIYELYEEKYKSNSLLFPS